MSMLAPQQGASTLDGQEQPEANSSEPAAPRSHTPTPPASNRDTAKLLERMKVLQDIADAQLAKVSEQVENLKEQLADEKSRARKFEKLAHKWKRRAKEPGPKQKLRLIRRKELAEHSKDPRLRKKHLRRMISDLDGYIKAKFRVYADGEEAMMNLLGDNSTSEHVQQLLTKLLNRLPHLKKSVQRTVVRRIEEHWTAEVGLVIRLRCRIPERPYQYLINSFSYKYSPETDKYEKHYIAPGVCMPSLGRNAGKNETIRLMNKYFDTAKPEALVLGSVEGITLSFKEALLAYCEQYLPECTDIQVQLAGDGAGVFRGVSQTTVAFKVIVPQAERDPDFHGLNSPFSSQSVLVFEGKEAYHEVKEAMARLLDELKDIEDNGITHNDKLFTLKKKGGGDMKWINMMCGAVPCNHTHGCAFCECPQAEWHLSDTRHTLRTIATIIKGAHLYHAGMTFPWKCPYCPKTFETKEELESEVAPSSEKKRLEYQIEHKGCMWKRAPVIPDLPPEDYVGDVLHFALREVHHCIEVTVRQRCTTQEKIDKLAEFLVKHVKCFIKVKKVKKRQGVKEEKTPNIIGRECSLTMQHSEGMVRTVLSEDDERFEKAMAVWRCLTLLWREMTTRIALDTPAFRETKARAIRQKARDYTAALIAHGSAQDVHLYSHVASEHLPAQVLRHGDLLDYSMQGLEHLHSQRKTDMRHHGNKRKTGNLKSRTAQSAKLEVAHRIINKSVQHRAISRHLKAKQYRATQAEALAEARTC
ncbi:hypothetical protein CYMTET_11077 [Cymbomonas tetramitiformis]|uniref:Uncharacterized protein n=1 Tax=Cymbomonas tetramitiformis TaxID=36881 RepID=A0AAE0LDI6_9CHLO|nr:hypothetical protein CYMTET_11077 [Cymbomonas tetramitiformis]